LAKKSLPSVFFFAESFLFGSRQRSLCAECFSVPRVFYLALGKAFFAASFFILLSAQKRTLGKASDSGSAY
jgi:hypothetical protein